MSKLIHHDDIAKVLYSEEEIKKRISELGAELRKDYADADGEIVLICILKGAVMFFADLARAMDLNLQMEFMGISSYGNEQKTSGIVRITKDIDTTIMGKHVIIAEDIMDSGLTLSHLMKLLNSREPASIKICCPAGQSPRAGKRTSRPTTADSKSPTNLSLDTASTITDFCATCRMSAC